MLYDFSISKKKKDPLVGTTSAEKATGGKAAPRNRSLALASTTFFAFRLVVVMNKTIANLRRALRTHADELYHQTVVGGGTKSSRNDATLVVSDPQAWVNDPESQRTWYESMMAYKVMAASDGPGLPDKEQEYADFMYALSEVFAAGKGATPFDVQAETIVSTATAGKDGQRRPRRSHQPLDPMVLDAMAPIVDAFVNRRWVGACLPSAALLTERMGTGKLVSGYSLLRDGRGHGGYTRHFWYRGADGANYDIGKAISVLGYVANPTEITRALQLLMMENVLCETLPDHDPSYTCFANTVELRELDAGYARWLTSPDAYWNQSGVPKWMGVLRRIGCALAEKEEGALIDERAAKKAARNARRNRKKREARKRLSAKNGIRRVITQPARGGDGGDGDGGR